jgi:hypothetical protein
LLGIVDRFGDYLPMCNTIAAQLVRDYFSGLALVTLY